MRPNEGWRWGRWHDALGCTGADAGGAGMTPAASSSRPEAGLPTLEGALQVIAAGAAQLDASPPRFPAGALAQLRDAGALRFNATPGSDRPPAAQELDLVRRVAGADGAVGRIFDGHLNAVERIAVQGPLEWRDRELHRILGGELWCGVWGGDPAPGEGPPAAVVASPAGEVLRGVKTFCSGAGGLHRALVLARDPEGGTPISAWVDLTRADVEVDEGWY